jgi:hypothetical protein
MGDDRSSQAEKPHRQEALNDHEHWWKGSKQIDEQLCAELLKCP